MSYFDELTAHYRDVRARLDGRPAPPWHQPQAPEPEPVLLTFEPEPEPDPTPLPLPDPLAGVGCSPDTKRAIIPILDKHQMTWAQFVARDNTRRAVDARAELYDILRERGWSYLQIGRLVGGRDHTTIVNSVQRFNARKESK